MNNDKVVNIYLYINNNDYFYNNKLFISFHIKIIYLLMIIYKDDCYIKIDLYNIMLNLILYYLLIDNIHVCEKLS